MNSAEQQRLSHRVKAPAVVMGGAITCLGALRSLARAGIEAFTITRPDEVVRKSRWYKPVPGQENLSPDNSAECLDALNSRDLVLFPCSDHLVSQAVRRIETGTSALRMSAPPASALDTLIDKSRFAELVNGLGVPRPLSWILDDGQLPAGLDDSLFGNAFLKPVDSQAFIARLGVKAYRVDSKTDAQRRLQEINSYDFSVILQEYIPGPSDQHYFIDGFVDRYGALKAMFARRRLRMHPPDFGNSSFMISVPLDELGDAARSLRSILEAVHYRGIFSAEFKFDERDTQFKIIEINTRPWWYVEFASRCGVNVCAMAYADALGEEVEEVSEYRVGQSLVYPIHDFRAWRDSVRRGGRFFSPWVGDWLRSSRPILAWDDPWPAISNAASFVLAYARRIIRRIARTGSSGD